MAQRKPNLTVRPVPETDADHGVYRPTVRYIIKLGYSNAAKL